MHARFSDGPANGEGAQTPRPLPTQAPPRLTVPALALLLCAPTASTATCPGFEASSSGAIGPAFAGAIRTADLDGDGDTDLVHVDDAVTVLVNEGAGVLTPVPTVDVGGVEHALTILEDFTGDDRPDLILAEPGSQRVSIAVNDGAGGFSDPEPLLTGVSPWGLAADDLDGDGRPDLVIHDLSAQAISVFHALPDGSFDAAQTITVDYEFRDLTLGDVDNDQRPDLIATVRINGIRSLEVHGNDGTGHFTAPPARHTLNPGLPRGITMADVDGDGDLDCLYADQSNWTGTRVVGVLRNDNAGQSFERSPAAFNGHGDAAVFADFDADGDLDFVVAARSSSTYPNRLYFYLNDGDGNFTYESTLETEHGARTHAIAVADLDGDASPDLAIGYATDDPLFESYATYLNPCVASSCNDADLAPLYGVFDLTDLVAFVDAFTTQDDAADLAEPFGVFDSADIQRFILAFMAGCP